jgi:hypothetical protein
MRIGRDSFSVHRGLGCTPCIAEKRGELTTRNTVSCTSAIAGRTKLPWGRRERQPDGSAAGGHGKFFEATPHAHPPSSAGATPAEKRTGTSLHEHLMRDLVKSRSARRPARFRCVRARGTVHGIAHQVKPGWWVAGRSGKQWGSPEKNSHGSLPRFHPTAVPDAMREASSAPPLATCRTRCRAR